METNLQLAHARAIDAKECVFKAQDALSLAWIDHAEQRPGAAPVRVLRKLERRLGKVRAELEALDVDVLAYRVAEMERRAIDRIAGKGRNR